MKLRTVITVLPGVLLLVQGCDFFRSLAGRPTSAELAALQCPAPADTARAGVTDSAAVIPGEMPEEMIYRSTEESYLVVAGCFREPRHADRLAAECRRQGYETCIVGFFSLVIGIALGVVASQCLSVIVAKMFVMDLSDFRFDISGRALVMTLLCFIGIYIVVFLLNKRSVRKNKLIDLLTAAEAVAEFFKSFPRVIAGESDCGVKGRAAPEFKNIVAGIFNDRQNAHTLLGSHTGRSAALMTISKCYVVEINSLCHFISLNWLLYRPFRRAYNFYMCSNTH